MPGAAEGIAVEDDHNQRDVSSDVTLVDSDIEVIFDDFDIGVIGSDGVHGKGPMVSTLTSPSAPSSLSSVGEPETPLRARY
jgi:hypothetical protein